MDRIRTAPRVAAGASLAGALGALLLPKCPACFAAYGSGLTALGLSPVTQQRLAGPLLAVAVLAAFGLVLRLSLRRRDYLTPLVSATGAGLILAGALVLHRPALVGLGAAFLVAAAVVNTARCHSSSR